MWAIWGVRRVVAPYTLAGLLVATGVSGAGYWAWNTWTAWRLERLASGTKTWPTSTILDNATLEVTTSCYGSALSYTVAIVPLPANPMLSRGERTDAAKAATDQVRRRLRVIRLQFEDADGITTAVYELPIDGFIRMYSDSDERLTRLEERSVRTCTPADYVRASKLKVGWIERAD